MAGLNETPKGERLHIAFFGRRNAGKSSLVNAFTGQNIAIVSNVKGTTTDPVYKSMELLPLGPVTIIDTPGIDDEGELGAMRIDKAYEVLNKADIAVIVTEAARPVAEDEVELIKLIKDKKIPFIIAKNKADLLEVIPENEGNTVYVSAKSGFGIEQFKGIVGSLKPDAEDRKIVSDLLNTGDTVVLVVPIDKAAPKGRLILPQQQTIRDLLDAGITALVCRDTELEATLKKLSAPPQMVITDSQVFGKVSKIVPKEIPLTSFSILMARYKGDLSLAVEGAVAIDGIKQGDKVLIAEGCTHHRQCEDIGTVKIPAWIEKRLGFRPDFTFVSGVDFPSDLSEYKIVIHCGGCTLNPKEMGNRLNTCRENGVPVTNYGILIAYLNGILPRTVAPFPDIAKLLK